MDEQKSRYPTTRATLICNRNLPYEFITNTLHKFHLSTGRTGPIDRAVQGVSLRSLAGIEGSNPAGDMDVYPMWVLYVVR
jgi:hypothetical protein